MSIKNINDLNNQANNLLPDNNQQLISPADVRNTIKDLNDSALNRIDDKIYLSLRAYSTTRNYEPQEGCFYNGIIYECVNTTSGVFNPADWEARSSPNGTWGSILGDINNQADLLVLLSGKQNTLTASMPLYISGNIINIQKATAIASGYLDVSDWVLFNSKENALSFQSPIERDGNVISIPYVSETQDGIVSAADWVAVNGSFIEVSYQDALNLVLGAFLKEGRYYKILADSRTNQGAGTYGDILVQASGTSTFSSHALLVSRLPIYEAIGVSAVLIDVYTNGVSPAVDEVYLWNGRAYKSLTGVNAGIPQFDTGNWELIPVSDETFYKTEIDIIHYDFIYDWIFYREDKYGNQLSFGKNGQTVNAMDSFQWGNPAHQNNIMEDAFLENINDGRLYRNMRLYSTYLLPVTKIPFSVNLGLYVENSVLFPGNGGIEVLGNGNQVQGTFSGVSVNGGGNTIEGAIQYATISGASNIVKSNATSLTLSGDHSFIHGTQISILQDSNSDFLSLRGNQAGFSLIASAHNHFTGNQTGVTLNNASHSFFVGNVATLTISSNAQYNTGFGSFSGITINGGIGNFLLHNQSGVTINGQNNLITGVMGGNTINGNQNIIGGSGGGMTIQTGSSHNMVFGLIGGNQLNNANVNSLLGELGGTNLTNASHNLLSGYASGIAMSGSSFNSLLGNMSGVNVTNGYYNSLLGGGGGSNFSNAQYNSLLGNNSGNTINNSSLNVLLGSNSGVSIQGSNANLLAGNFSGSFTNSNNNSALGSIALSISNASYNTIGGHVSGSLSGFYNTLFGNHNSLTTSGNSNTVLGGASGSVSGSNNFVTGLLTTMSVAGSNNLLFGIGGTTSISGNNNVSLMGSQQISGWNNFVIGDVNNALSGSNNLFFGNSTIGTNEGSGNVFLLNKSKNVGLFVTAEGYGNFIAGDISSGLSGYSLIDGRSNVLIGAVTIDEINSGYNVIIGDTPSLSIPETFDHVAILNVQHDFSPERSNVLYVPNNLVAVGSNSKLATYQATTLSDDRVYTFQDADGTVAFLSDISSAVNNALPLAGGTMTGLILFENNQGIDSIASGTNTLNIGTANAAVINIGNAGATVNIQGTLAYQNVTNLEVTDKLIRLNKNGGIASATESGIELEENTFVTGYVKTNATREAWLLKAPATQELALELDQLTADRALVFPDISGTLLLSEGVQDVLGVKSFSNGLNSKTISINGTAGDGFLDLFEQSANPVTPAASVLRLFSGSGSTLSWRINNGADTFIRTLSGTLTASRNYTLFDQDDTLVGITVAQTLSNKTLSEPIINVGSDASGDIYYRNSGGEFARLSIGTSGDLLSVNSGIPQWAAPSWLSLSGGTLSGDVGNASTGYFRLPNGSTAQRPGSPLSGMLRYNTSLNKLEVYENGTWVSFLSSSQSYLPTTGGTLSGDVDNSATGFLRVPNGTTAQRPGSPSSGMLRYNTTLNAVEAYQNGSWTSLGSGGGSSTVRRLYHFALIGQASSTTGLFAKSAVSAGNPSGMLPTTNPSSSGFNNSGNDPYLILNNCTIVSMRLTLYSVAVAQGTVGSNPLLRMAVYKIGATSRTLVGNLDFAINPSSCGIWNDVSGNHFQTTALSGLSLSLTAGDLIGVEFVNQSSSNDQINAIAQVQVMMETSE